MQHYYECLIYNLKSPVMNFFTYSFDAALNKGDLVEVSLRNKTYFAIIWNVVQKPSFKCKNISSLVFSNALQDWQLEMIDYIHRFYFANIGTCLGLFLPKKILNKKFDWETDFHEVAFELKSENNLNEDQKGIFESLVDGVGDLSLLHGVTGSGKTEIYLQLIFQILNSDSSKQILLLVPEISLTPQVTNYFTKYISSEFLTIYHSKLNVTEKFEAWKKIKSGQTRLVIGSRSALFLPYNNLSQIIVDEEHDGAYKQEQDPKYHVRNLTQWLNARLGLPVLYGSATPSLEIFHAAKVLQKLKYYYLGRKAKTDFSLSYKLIDMRDEKKAGNFHFVSNFLAEEIRRALKNQSQVLLLHNRRGSASFLQCMDCGFIKECDNCSISLTPHRSHLQCHYCSFSESMPTMCQKCSGSNLNNIGLGVKKIEDDLVGLFPNAKIVRVDSDTNSKKDAHIDNYEIIKNGEADIIVGTQIIATGIDVENISLVGVINVDQHLNFPDFRAHERTFQLMTQFAGRAGRGRKQGMVVLQTYQPENTVIQNVKSENILEFLESELEFRSSFGYPPFSKILKLTFSNSTKAKVEREVKRVEGLLQKVDFKNFKSGVPLIEKKHNKFYHQILINSLNPNPILEYLQLGSGWSVDRDPLNTI